jgi:hypothetical protein
MLLMATCTFGGLAATVAEQEIAQAVYEVVVRRRGSISAEHASAAEEGLPAPRAAPKSP